LNAPVDKAAMRRSLRDFLDLGNAKYAFAGMVRSIFMEFTPMTWAELEGMGSRGKLSP